MRIQFHSHQLWCALRAGWLLPAALFLGHIHWKKSINLPTPRNWSGMRYSPGLSNPLRASKSETVDAFDFKLQKANSCIFSDPVSSECFQKQRQQQQQRILSWNLAGQRSKQTDSHLKSFPASLPKGFNMLCLQVTQILKNNLPSVQGLSFLHVFPPIR